MWTVDPRACQIINDAHALFDFNQLAVLHYVRAHVLFNVFNPSHVSVNASQSMFRQLMHKINVMSDEDRKVPFDKHFFLMKKIYLWRMNKF